MYLGSMVRPPGYSPGTHLSSIQKRRIRGAVVDIAVQVGNELVIPEGLQIVCLTELLYKCIFDRYFVQLQNRMIPIYLRITNVHTAEYSSVLLCNQGISQVFRMLHGEDNNNKLLRNVMLDCITEELEAVDPMVIAAIKDVPLSEPINTEVGNDSAEVLPESQSGVKSVGYPWNVVTQLQPTINCWIDSNVETNHMRYANYLADLPLQVYGVTDGPNLLQMEVAEYLTPVVPVQYQNYTYDNLTTLMAKEQMLPKGEIVHSLSCRSMRNVPVSTTILPDRSQYECPTELSSNILEFCVWVHNLPYLECGGKYILPTKNLPEQFTWTTRDREVSSIPQQVTTQMLVGELARICRYWDPNLTEIEFLKSRYDELYVHFVSGGTLRRMYFDLSVCSLLTQAIAQLD